MGFFEILEEHGRGRGNFYIPHRIEPTISIPAGLWRNNWVGMLSGAGLLVLLQLLAYQQATVETGWGRVAPPLRALFRRGRLLIERDRLRTHNQSEDATNRGLNELKQLGLAVELRARSGTFIGLTDAELTQSPASVGARLPT